MTPNLQTIFEWFTFVEIVLARAVIFALFLIGLWTVFQWGRKAHGQSANKHVPVVLRGTSTERDD